MSNLLALPDGTELVGDYRIKRVIGAGGFGITYLAEEPSLARHVTIKEYFPSDFAARSDGFDAAPRSQNCAEDYQWGLDRFIDEAKTLAKFDHPNIVRVYRYFRLHNTGYMVLHFEEGASFKGWLENLHRTPRQEELDEIVSKLLDALEMIHAENFLHRDIAPDNIIIRKDGDPVLIDFGSARGAIAQHSKTVSALVKPGYSPYEQYGMTSKNQGPWTDIYSLAATLYYAISGKRPIDAPSRIVADEMASAREVALSSYRPGFLAAIDKALQLQVDKRPRDIDHWRRELLAPSVLQPKVGQPSAVQPSATQPLQPEPIAGAARAGQPVKLRHRVARNMAGLKTDQSLNAPPYGTPSNGAAPGVSPPPTPSAEHASPTNEALQSHKLPTPPSGSATPQPHSEPQAPPAAAASPQAQAAKPWVETVHADQPAQPRRGLMELLLGVKRKYATARYATKRRVKERRMAQRPVAAPPRPARIAGAGSETPVAPSTPQQRATTVLAGQSPGQPERQSPGQSPKQARQRDHRQSHAAPQRAQDRAKAHRRGAAAAKPVGKKLAIEKRKPPRPQPIRRKRAGSLRSLGIKLLIGVGVASVAVAMQDKLPRLETRGVGLFSTQKTKVALVNRLSGHKGGARGVSFTQNGKRIVSTGADATIKLWDSLSGNLIRTIELDNGPAGAFAVDGRRAVTGHKDGTVALWDLDTGQKLASFRRNEANIWSLTFAGDPGRVAAAAHDWSVTLWDERKTGAPHHVFKGHENAAQAIAYSKSRSLIASGGADETVKLWDASSLELIRTYKNLPDFVTSLAFSENGKRLAAACLDGNIRIYSTNSRRRKRTLSGHERRVTGVAFSPNGKYLASVSIDGTMRVWNHKSGRTLKTINNHIGPIMAVSFSKDGKHLATAGEDGSLRIWELSALVGEKNATKDDEE